MAPKTVSASPPTRTNIAKTSAAVSVLTTTTTLAAANPSRIEITVTNDGANIVYLMLNTSDGTTVPTATASNGIRLAATGGSWTSNAYTGPIAAIAATATTVVTVVEI